MENTLRSGKIVSASGGDLEFNTSHPLVSRVQNTIQSVQKVGTDILFSEGE